MTPNALGGRIGTVLSVFKYLSSLQAEAKALKTVKKGTSKALFERVATQFGIQKRERLTQSVEAGRRIIDEFSERVMRAVRRKNRSAINPSRA